MQALVYFGNWVHITSGGCALIVEGCTLNNALNKLLGMLRLELRSI